MRPPEFFDTHAHLDFPEFGDEVPRIVERAESAGISRIITIGTTLESSRKAVEMAVRFPTVYAAVGWHPSYVTSAPSELPSDFRDLAAHPKVVAIGETGLDYTRLPADGIEKYKERQACLFRQQLELAAECGLNVVIHQRDAFEDVLAVLRPYTTKLRAVFHCFVGTPGQQAAVAALNCLVSFTGIITFKNAETVRQSLRATPLNGLMLETDCPFLAPVPHRGKRCEPAYVAEIAAFVAREKDCTLEQLSDATCATARQFFSGLK